MIKFLLGLQFIFRPDYWVMNNSYSKELDKFMNDLLDNYEFESINEYTAKLGGITIWISNVPYAAMIPYEREIHNLDIRPSRLTIKKGLKKLKNTKKDTKKTKKDIKREKIKAAIINLERKMKQSWEK